MEAKKSFLEILRRAISTFKSAFWGIVLTYCFAIPVLGSIHYILQSFLSNQRGQISTLTIILSILLLIPYIYGGILLQTWQTLIIKSNMFTGLNNLPESFKKSLLKALQICGILIVLIPIFAFIAFMFAKGFPSCIKIMPLLFIPLLPLTLFFTGIVLQESKFINALINAAGICFTYYFKILGYTILLMIVPIIATILIMLLMIIPLFWFIGIILMIFLQVMTTPFLNCFFAELYFDLAMIDEEKPIEDLTELSESYPDVVDINQEQEQIYKEETLQPKMQQEAIQTPHKNETPDGLKQLGGNYEDKK